MTMPQPSWLDGRRALVVGGGAAADAVAKGFAAAGALVERLTDSSVDADAIAASFLSAERLLGGQVDILVHGGAMIVDGRPDAIALDAWRAGMSADIDSRFFFAAEFARRTNDAMGMGSILLLLPSERGAKGRSAKASAHGALDNLVKSLAVEWARDGIRTNAIASEVVEDYAAKSDAEQSSLVHLAAYIVSDYGAYITGMVMGVDELA